MALRTLPVAVGICSRLEFNAEEVGEGQEVEEEVERSPFTSGIRAAQG